jgi:hypothetical protein
MTRDSKIHSRQQTLNSLAVLIILTAIGGGIFLTQFDFNPSVLPQDFFLPAGDKNKDPAISQTADSIVPLPPGMVPLTSSEIFNPQTLSDKINGKAELYLSAGFGSLASQRFKDKDGSNLWMEVYIYDMGKGQNAFSVFSAQRRQGAASLDLTPYAYRTQNALFLVHGPFYVEIIASEATNRAFGPMKLLAESFIDNTPVKAVTFQEKDFFPDQGLVAESISLISADAFGFDRLNQVYTAEYEIQEKRLMAFLSRRPATREAQELASAYHNFLATFGGQNIDANLPIKDAKLLEIMETYEVIFSYGPFIAGVREAEDKAQATNLALQLYEKLKEMVDES